MKWIIDRAAEPSTWAGIGAIVTPAAAGIQAGIPWWQVLAATAAGVLAIVMPERARR